MQITQRFLTSADTEKVWQILADVENWTSWNSTIVAITPLTPEGMRTGARYSVQQRKLSPTEYEVTDYTPNKAFTWVHKFPGGEMVADHRIAATNEGTSVELSFSSRGFLGNFFGAIFSKLIAEYVVTEAKGLKQRCDLF